MKYQIIWAVEIGDLRLTIDGRNICKHSLSPTRISVQLSTHSLNLWALRR